MWYFLCQNITLAKKCKWHLQILKETKSHTCESEDNMKKTLVKVKSRKKYSCKHERKNYENKGALEQ